MSYIEEFINVTTDGNEPAIKRGNVVPNGGVNLSWTNSPEFNSQNNILLIDTSNINPNNVDTSVSGIYMSDIMGILQDNTGNQLFQDQFPAISDVFNVTGDLTNVDLSQVICYPYVHESKYFHIDWAALTLGSGLSLYKSNIIKVVDSKGNLYVDENNNPLYLIKICPVLYLDYTTPQIQENQLTNQTPYRVYAYLNNNTNENLYLVYNKVEIDNNGNIVNQIVNYQEIINPNPVFEYRPEPAEVVDPTNRDRSWFSSAPVYAKENALNLFTQDINGYNIFAPQKAVTDPRIFQLFRWRINCDFTEIITTETIQATINVGVVITNSASSSIIGQIWNSLSNPDLNFLNINFQNPLNSGPTVDKTQDSYWYVNFDTITTTQLSMFDMLVWAPGTSVFDFSQYMPLITYFTQTLGKTLLIDTENITTPENLGFDIQSPTIVQPFGFESNVLGTSNTNALVLPSFELTVPNTSIAQSIENVHGWPYTSTNNVQTFYSGVEYTQSQTTSNKWQKLFNCSGLGGWNIESTEAVSELQTNFGNGGGSSNYILSYPQTALWLISGTEIVNYNLTDPFPAQLPNTNYLFNANQTYTTKASVASTTATSLNTANEIILTIPEIPTGTYLSSIEVIQSYSFTGNPGSGIQTFLLGGEFNNVSQTAVVPVGSTTGNMYALTTGSEVSSLGAELIINVSQLDSSLPYNEITSVNVTVTCYYLQDQDKQFSYSYTTDDNGNFPFISLPLPQIQPLMMEYQNVLFSSFSILSSATNGLAGAQQLVYNACLITMSGQSLYQTDTNSLVTSYSFSSPWTLSWVIDTTDNPNVLTEQEKALYNFVYLPEDSATPVTVWQRQLSSSTVEELINNSMTPDMLQATQYATRTYSIEVTNSNVQTPTNLADESIPYAWTSAYTPALIIPPDITTYIIQEKEIPGDYLAAQYISQSYPSLPYACETSIRYSTLYNLASDALTTWTASGTAVDTYDTTVYVPPETIIIPGSTVTQEIQLSWANSTNQATGWWNLMPYKWGYTPNGIHMWSSWNYYNNAFGPGCLCWPFYGLTGIYQEGSTGSVVQFIQDFLNRWSPLTGWRMPYGYLAVDGNYGSITANTVLSFQEFMGARYLDGVVDAETFGLIGAQIITHNMQSLGASYQIYYSWAHDYITPQSISDSNAGTVFGKRSWVDNGPWEIWDIFLILFDQPYSIHSITFNPWVQGESPTMLFEAVDVRNGFTPQDLYNFDAETMMIKNMNLQVRDGQVTTIPFAPQFGNAIILGCGQDQISFPVTSQFFGVRDITAEATVTRVTPPVTEVIPGYYKTTVESVGINITATGTVNVGQKPTSLQVHPNYTGQGTLSNIAWHSVYTNSPTVEATITPSGLLTLDNVVNDPTIGSGVIYGPFVPLFNQTYYSMDTNKNLSPVPENGYISKADGIKLLCDINKQPIGIPDAIALQTAGFNSQFASLSINRQGTDSRIIIGFYDLVHQEFIVDANGEPNVTWGDYVSRGAQNIYIGVVSTYEVDIPTSLPTYESELTNSIPNTDDAPMVPQMTVMPLYGVSINSASKIAIAPMPPNLGVNDVWPIYIQTGQFNSSIYIPSNITTYMAPYIGTTVQAFYSIPEAEDSSWSTLFGWPNIDVVGEQPIITGDYSIQVRQAPILMKQFPTNYQSPADPLIPIFKVYTRTSLNANWITLDNNQIQDYNTSTGEIYLTNINPLNDPNLIQVDYTSANGNYIFKRAPSGLLNLNPYPGQGNGSLINQTIYIYIEPHYVLDANGNVIPGSVLNRTLNFTLDPSIFNPTSPNYDPLAFQLGIVKVIPVADINSLVLIDSRSRGGGVEEGLTYAEIINILQDASNYWDLNYGANLSYPSAGYVIIRLPIQLKSMYSNDFINRIIRKNLTAGVAYKLQDLNGNDWNQNVS